MDGQGNSFPMATSPEIGAAPVPASAPTSPLRSQQHTSTFHSTYGSLFRPVKSCANLESMNMPPQGQEREMAPLPNPPPGGFLSRSIFKSVKSCINLESMDRQANQRQQQQALQTDQGKDSSSGILFSSLKGFKIQSNMVSERDINLMAPMSS